MNKVERRISDLGVSAYLMMHNYHPSGKKNREIVFMIDPDESKDFHQLQIDYLTSEFHRFDACIMSLKKMTEYTP